MDEFYFKVFPDPPSPCCCVWC